MEQPAALKADHTAGRREGLFDTAESLTYDWLTLRRSRIHNLGLFSTRDIEPHLPIVEYAGEIVREPVADARERMYQRYGIQDYMFRITDDVIVDATLKGGRGRYINHSCEPNSYAEIYVQGSQQIVCIYSKRLIRAGEEITYDYQFPSEEDKIPCRCGAPSCRGTLN